ncbi:MAG: ATP-binding protein [Candidatus Scalindua sp.]
MEEKRRDCRQKVNIIVVEDDEGLSRLIARSLKCEGFDVGVVHNGAQAIDLVVNNPADLMLLDYKLPDMSAGQIINALKEQKIEIQFIMMTGHGDEKVAVEMMKAGARDYIVKEGGFLEILPHVIRLNLKQLGDEKKLAEAERLNTEKANMLATINKELEEFVYIVSHDLKEPLFVIEGYTSRLYRAYKDVYNDKEKYYIERIRTNVKRMSQKIQEIMEVLKAGKIACNFRENDSGKIVKEIVSSLKGRIKTNKINVLIEHNLPAVFCDERRMKDVFSNLITNAIKFMGNGKQAKTLQNLPRSQAELGNERTEQSDGESGRISIGCNKEADYYKFFVEDTGIGIREEYQEQIFKIFRRLKDIEAEGTGVGLAIVKKIVELHAGKLWIESPLKDGRGSRFCFTIPIKGDRLLLCLISLIPCFSVVC